MCRAASGVAPDLPTRAAAIVFLFPVSEVSDVFVGFVVDDL